MAKINLKQAIENYINTLKVEGTPYYIDGGENKPLYVETDEKLLIQINDEQIDLFKFTSKDEYEELISWDILGTVVLKEDMLKCFILNGKNLLDKDIVIEGSADNLGYKVLIDPRKVLEENYELFIANMPRILGLNETKKRDSKFVDTCDYLIKEKRLCVFEINNLKILNQDLQKKIQSEPGSFIRTNLIIINNDINSQLTFFEFNISEKEEADVAMKKDPLLLKYPFYSDLLCFLESAQKMQYNNLKYLEYYHVLEYFITSFAYKNLETSIKKFVSIYLEGDVL